jgi:hypothetical protein
MKSDMEFYIMYIQNNIRVQYLIWLNEKEET